MEPRRVFWVGLALAAVTLFLYWPVTGFNFVAFDDELYVYENPHVAAGLSWAGLKWAATAITAANWHPLTLVSLMLDRQLFGLAAGGYHLTNLLFHTANTLLLLLLFRRMTKALWASALVAALFAWHPLNVESVAWVAERKNVLSTFFLLLTLLSYLCYTEKKTIGWYMLALGFFALGLMAKPMLVSLPLMLLLLDYWPLKRFAVPPEVAGWQTTVQDVWKLIREKIPFFSLSAAVCVITCLAQAAGHSLKSLQEVPLVLRLLNAPVAYVTYLAKTFWPENLCVFYPLPATLPLLAAFGSILFLAAATILFFHWRTRCRWWLAGWLWFLVTLVPVIGLVQTGGQALADRHAYVPLLGIFFAGAWSLRDWVLAKPSMRPMAVGLSIAALFVCLVVTQRQLMYWRDSIALFTRAVAVTENNYYACNNLGVVLADAGRNTEAVAQFAAAVRIKPDDPESQYHLGQELMALGKYSEAQAHFAAALRQLPDNVLLLNNLGVALALTGQRDAALQKFFRAMEVAPAYPKSYFNQALIFQQAGQNGAAYTNFLAALKLNPDWPEVLDHTALFLITCPEPQWRDAAAAENFARRANVLAQQAVPSYQETLAAVQATRGDFSNAISNASLAVQKAAAGGQVLLAGKIAAELKAYQAGRIPTNFAIAPDARADRAR